MQNALQAMEAQSDPLLLVFRKDVQLDLGMDLGQRNKFDNLHDRQVRELLQTRQQNRRNPGAVADFQAKQKRETQDKIDTLLTKEQRDRLNQIVLQLKGGATLLSPDVQKQLQLTGEQTQRIKQIQDERDTKVKQLQESIAQGAIRPQEIQTQMDQIQKETGVALNDVLTPEQQEQLQKLLGRPFKPGT